MHTACSDEIPNEVRFGIRARREQLGELNGIAAVGLDPICGPLGNERSQLAPRDESRVSKPSVIGLGTGQVRNAKLIPLYAAGLVLVAHLAPEPGATGS
jgi:hypothetical protein